MKPDKYQENKNIVDYRDSIRISKIMNNKREQEWLKENKEVIEKHNKRMKREDSFSDEHRRF